MNDKPVIGVIGAGMMSQVGHIPFLLGDGRCVVKSIAETRPSLVKYLGDKYGFSDVVSDHRELLIDPEIDAIVLSAPRPATGPLTLECLTCGKHLLAEKPMAHSVQQAELLLDAARSENKLYAVGYMKRYDPGVQEALRVFEQLLKQEDLGKLLNARFYNHSKSYAFAPPAHQRPSESRSKRFDVWSLAPEWMPSDYYESYAWFMNSASHDVNLLSYFFPSSVVQSAFVSRDQSFVAICAANEVPVTLEITRAQAGKWVEGADFIFEHGILRVVVPSPMDTNGVASVSIETDQSLNSSLNLNVGKGWSFERQIEDFISCLIDGGAPKTAGEQGLHDLRLIESMWKEALGI